MRWPLAEALRPPTSATARSASERGIAEHGDGRRRIVQQGQQRRVVGLAREDHARAEAARGRAVRARRHRDGRDGRRRRRARRRGPGRAARRARRRPIRSAPAADDRRPGRRPRCGRAAAGLSRRLGVGPCRLMLSEPMRGSVALPIRAADVRVVADEHQHGDYQRKLNERSHRPGSRRGPARARTRPAPPARRCGRAPP